MPSFTFKYKKLQSIKFTGDCQKADPPTAASKYMIIMKICTSVTSMLSKRKKKKKHNIYTED